jgi:transposase InsO family protein
MESAYFTPRHPGSFGGVQSLRRYSGQSLKEVRKWLSAQNAYTLHKPNRLHFKRRKTYSKGINDLFQADLVDLSNISKYNDGYRYLLTCIDVFSKYAFAVPLKTKSGKEVTEAFLQILNERKCHMLQTDKGTEYLNSTFQSMLKRNDIHFYTSENEDLKAAVVERFNRTLKTKMFKYFSYKNTLKYIDVLDDLLHSYNNTYHRSIDMTPSQVDTSNENTIAKRLYPIKPNPKWKFDVGDRVRISKAKRVFKKGYLPNWTDELFTIAERFPTHPVTYALKDYGGEDIKGKFYEFEIQKVIKEDDVYDVEKILKTRKRKGKTQHLVKWKGYPDKFNSWIDG